MYYARRDNIVLRDINGLYFLVDIIKKDYADNSYVLLINELGKYIWECLQKTQSIDQLTDSILGSLNDDLVEYSEVYNDTKEFVEYLKDENYVIGVDNQVWNV